MNGPEPTAVVRTGVKQTFLKRLLEMLKDELVPLLLPLRPGICTPHDPRIRVPRRSSISKKIEQIVAIGFEFGGANPGTFQ